MSPLRKEIEISKLNGRLQGLMNAMSTARARLKDIRELDKLGAYSPNSGKIVERTLILILKDFEFLYDATKERIGELEDD